MFYGWPMGVGFVYYYTVGGKSAQEAIIEAAKIPAFIFIARNLLPLIEIWPSRITAGGQFVRGMGPLRFAGAVGAGYLLGAVVGWGISRAVFGKEGGDDFIDFVIDPMAAPGKLVGAVGDAQWTETPKEIADFVVPPSMRNPVAMKVVRAAGPSVTKIVRAYPRRHNPTGLSVPTYSDFKRGLKLLNLS